MTGLETIPVGVAEYALSTDERPLSTSGVGSCGVVAIHDESAMVSGLLHFMLPRASARTGRDGDAKFADAGLEALFSAFEAQGGRTTRAWAKLAGGAAMFDFDSFETPVGEQNVAAAQDELRSRGVSIRAADVGGNVGRHVTFDPRTGQLIVKTADGERERY
ncbi:chemotaxis protein CheD [Natrialbaceae archaeon A-arb3/5]